MELATQVNRLEDALGRLAAAQARTESALAQLAEARAGTEQRLDRVEAQLEQLTAAQARTQEQLAQLTAAQARTEAQLEQLTAAQARTEAQVARTQEQLAQLTAAQARTEAQLEQLTAAQARTASELLRLMQWQQGEAGRRRGERYEHDVARRAAGLFAGGKGGPTDRESVERRLSALLGTHLTRPALGEATDGNPFLADLVWWKGDRIAVVEISHMVDEADVSRAAARAETLREAGADAIAVVLGDVWNDEDTRRWAETRGVEWKVGNDLSDGFIAFRRLPAEGVD